ncbi:MAG: hypothetical protein HYY04_06945 [Chloroflexi bacterium]|nr:hypothetical protein [Chloroflexota bacterium]
MPGVRPHSLLLTITLTYLALATTYSLVTPLFEAPDELYHYAYVKHLAEGRGLPALDREMRQHYIRQEVGQPPLYYALGVLLTVGLPTGDELRAFRFNPHAGVGTPLAIAGNRNLVVPPNPQRTPYHRLALAVHLVRLLSIALGGVAVVATYGVALALRPGDRTFAALAAAFTAFNPQFLFIAGAVNNDNLITALGGLGLLLVLHGLTGKLGWRYPIGLGLVTGLATLGKLGGLALAPLAVCGLAWVSWRNRSLGWFVRAGALYGAIALALVGPWMARNVVIGGEPFGIASHLTFGHRNVRIDLAGLLAEVPGFWMSFWGVFGAFSLLPPPAFYHFFNAVSALAALGLTRGLVSALGRGKWRGWLRVDRTGTPPIVRFAVIVLWLALVLAALVRWTLIIPASQGRLIFPAIASIAILLALGLWQLPLPRPLTATAVGVAMLAVAAAVPFGVIQPAYARPPVLRDPGSVAVARRAETVHGDRMKLLGYTVEHLDAARLTGRFCWQALAPMDRDYSVFVQVHDTAGKPLGQVDTYPGLGSYSTSQLSPGDTICDRYGIAFSASDGRQRGLLVMAGVYDFPTRRALPARNRAGGNAGNAPIVGLLGEQLPADETFQAYSAPPFFDEQVALHGFRLVDRVLVPGGQVQGTLVWEAVRWLDRDYTVFVHLVGPPGRVAQYDSQPRRATFPTSQWAPGELVADDFAFSIPARLSPGRYDLVVGLYELGTGRRLPVADSDLVVLRTYEVPGAME